MARFPAGWLVDWTGRPAVSAVAGVLIASLATALLPHASSQMMLLVLVAVFGAVTGLVGVATGVALAASAMPAARGLVMGGYSTALYFGLGLGSFALGPVITRHGYSVGFAVGGAAGVIGAIAAAVLWSTAACRSEDAGVVATSGA
jgi:predicted MFS family arabinose efflux permease